MSSSEEEEFTGDLEEEEEEEEESEEYVEDDDDDDDDGDDDVPLSSFKKKEAVVSNGNNSRSSRLDDNDDDDDDDDSSDDDIPLAALAKKKQPKPKQNGTKKKKPKAKSSKASAQPPPKKKAKTSSSSRTIQRKSSAVSNRSDNNKDKKYEWASAALYGTECQKGLLIQRLLCRWWYAYAWPDPSTIPDKAPEHYDTLDGFPGVFVCTEGQKVGHILDMRDKSQCPSFANFCKKSSQELQRLFLKALEEQKKQLIAAEGTAGTTLEKELDGLIKWATKLKPDKADKEAATVLKASGLKL